MAADEGYVLGAKAIAQIQRLIREDMRRLKNETPQSGRYSQTQRTVTGFTTTAITAATSALDGHTTFSFGVLRFNTTSEDYEDTGTVLDGINIDASLVAVAGTLVRCEFIDGRWQVYWCSCEADPDLTALI